MLTALHASSPHVQEYVLAAEQQREYAEMLAKTANNHAFHAPVMRSGVLVLCAPCPRLCAQRGILECGILGLMKMRIRCAIYSAV